MASTACEISDFTLEEVPEIDSTLLMELLEEPNGEHTSDEGIERVMRSLESEIVGIGSIDHRCQDFEESRLDDILSDLNDEDSRYMMTVENPFRWVEYNLNGDEMFLDGDRMIMYDDQTDYEGFYYEESSVEQLYIPLWQRCNDVCIKTYVIHLTG